MDYRVESQSVKDVYALRHTSQASCDTLTRDLQPNLMKRSSRHVQSSLNLQT